MAQWCQGNAARGGSSGKRGGSERQGDGPWIGGKGGVGVGGMYGESGVGVTVNEGRREENATSMCAGRLC